DRARRRLRTEAGVVAVGCRLSLETDRRGRTRPGFQNHSHPIASRSPHAETDAAVLLCFRADRQTALRCMHLQILAQCGWVQFRTFEAPADWRTYGKKVIFDTSTSTTNAIRAELRRRKPDNATQFDPIHRTHFAQPFF